MARTAAVKQDATIPGVDPAELGRRVRAARHERGLSLAQVGGEELSRSFLSTVEHGRTRISLRALSIVADRLGRPISYFLDNADSSPATDQALTELMLDEVERVIGEQRASDALRLLDESAIPDSLQGRSLWLRGRALTDLG